MKNASLRPSFGPGGPVMAARKEPYPVVACSGVRQIHSQGGGEEPWMRTRLGCIGSGDIWSDTVQDAHDPSRRFIRSWSARHRWLPAGTHIT